MHEPLPALVPWTPESNLKLNAGFNLEMCLTVALKRLARGNLFSLLGDIN